MAERTECLCDGKLTGIETIYTVVDGKQINIPGKIEALRIRSRNKELFCPCGCGTNLILVAGEKQLKEQHFRIDDENYNSRCEYVTEGKVSVRSKIVLKCWLDDKLDPQEIETRVPIYAVDDISRKFEFSLLVREKLLAISYHYERASLSDEKLEILDSNSKGLQIIYIVDKKNDFNNGQYPERLIKTQNKQGYCLLLDVEKANYFEAKMKAVFFAKNAFGLWEEIIVAEGFLKDFSLSDNGDIYIHKEGLKELLEKVKDNFAKKYEQELLEIKKDQEERLRVQKEIEQQEALKKVEPEREYKNNKVISKTVSGFELPSSNFEILIVSSRDVNHIDFSRRGLIIKDEYGDRLYKCKYCGKVGTDDSFGSVSGENELNGGTCKECFKKPEVEKAIKSKLLTKSVRICPKCGGTLKEKDGRYGKFMGCSNFPKCRYSENV